MAEHDRFLQQLQDRFKTRKERKEKLRVIFWSLNKQDLWSTAFYDNVSKFENWFERHVEKWGALGISVGEAPIKVSATDPRDIGQLKSEIVRAANLIGKPSGAP